VANALLIASILALANAVRSEAGGAALGTFLVRVALYAALAGVFLAGGLVVDLPMHALTLMAIVAIVCAAVIEMDLRWLIIPDVASIILICCAALLGPDHWTLAWIGAALGGGLLLIVKLGFQAFRGIDGLGWGDVKFAGAIGALLGPVHTMTAIGAGALASAVLLAYAVARQDAVISIGGRPAAPLGVGLAGAAIATFALQQAGILQ